MKIADHYKEINEYYAELNKSIAQEREERERREIEDGPAEAYHRELDVNHEWDNAEAEVDAIIRDIEEEDEESEEDEERDEESEEIDDDDFFARLDP